MTEEEKLKKARSLLFKMFPPMTILHNSSFDGKQTTFILEIEEDAKTIVGLVPGKVDDFRMELRDMHFVTVIDKCSNVAIFSGYIKK